MSKDKKITAITPNLQEKLRNKIAGMVDLVCRVVVESDGTRKLQFKSNEVVFGGGRLQGVKSTECPLDWNSLMGVYKEALNSQKPNTAHMNKVEEFKKAHTDRVINMSDNSTYVENVGTCIINDPDDEPKVEEPKPEEVQAHAEDTPVEVTQPVRKTRKPRYEDIEIEIDTKENNATQQETVEAPVRRTRRVRG